MKKAAKNFVASILGRQVRRLQARADFKVIAVAGSVGKTSTKLAIASLLSQKYNVRVQAGNYNDLVSVPLIFFGEKLPNIYNPLAWLKVFRRISRQIKKPYPHQIVIVELGTDGPGQIGQFKKYLQVDIGVLTAIAPEHMEFFSDLQAVAKEELSLADLSCKLLVNSDLVATDYLLDLKIPFSTYGTQQLANTRLGNIVFNDQNCDFDVEKNGQIFMHGAHESILEPQIYSVAAAIAVAIEMGMNADEIERGIRSIKPISGRMQRLEGTNNSTIIDDTYNASPQAAKSALNMLYRIKAPQKIAILGNMNELGGYSQSAHRELGELCDPRELDLVATIGPDANKFLAVAAEAKGCKVKTFTSPQAAGEFVRAQVKPGAVILVKGSQNKVFAEEAVKLLLANQADTIKLVRQSTEWLKIKERAFG